jgi:hypothetical protein
LPDEERQLRVVQVVGDHIDRHPQVASTCRQGGQNLGRLLNDPTGQQGRQAYPLDHPQDFGRRHMTAIGAPPAQQRLRAHHTAGWERNLGLKVELELLGLERPGDLGFEHRVALGLDDDLATVDVEGAPARLGHDERERAACSRASGPPACSGAAAPRTKRARSAGKLLERSASQASTSLCPASDTCAA